MFNMINIGERAGSGIPNIFFVWKKQGWVLPTIEESFNPERTILSLVIGKSDDRKATIKSDDKKATIKTIVQKDAIVEYLTDHIYAKSSDLSELLGIKSTRTKGILSELIEEGTIVAEGSNRNRIYKLKA